MAAPRDMLRDLVPAADGETDDLCDRFLGYAAQQLNAAAWGVAFELACVYLAGHLLTIRARGMAGQQGAGPITNEKAGDLSVGYGSLIGMSGSSDAELLTTPAGAQFVALRKAHVIGALVVR